MRILKEVPKKVKLTYIDSDIWRTEVDIIMAISCSDEVHNFIAKKNVITLPMDEEDEYEEDITIIEKENLLKEIGRVIKEREEIETIYLIDFELELEEIFKDIINIAREYNISVYILEKSEWPIGNNITMNIDLEEFDKNYEDVKKDIEKALKESIEYSRIENMNKIESQDKNKEDLYKKEISSNDNLSALLKYALSTEDRDIDENSTEIMYLKNSNNGTICLTSDGNSIKIETDIHLIEISFEDAKKIIKALEVIINE